MVGGSPGPVELGTQRSALPGALGEVDLTRDLVSRARRGAGEDRDGDSHEKDAAIGAPIALDPADALES